MSDLPDAPAMITVRGRTAGRPGTTGPGAGSLAGPPSAGHTVLVGDWGDLPLPAPLVALGVVGILALLLRWAFGHGRSLVERRPLRGSRQEYGLLVCVAAPRTFIEAEMIRRRLLDAGLRATLAPTTGGPAVMVFPEDAAAARRLLG